MDEDKRIPRGGEEEFEKVEKKGEHKVNLEKRKEAGGIVD